MEKNVDLEIINEVIESENNEQFIIDTDEKAEWALKKIAQEKLETQRYINVCKAMISEYQDKIAKSEEKFKKEVQFLEYKLQDYFQTVEHKVTKTQETYKLPSGTLKLKKQNSEFKRDDTELLNWLKENEMIDYIKVEEKPNWSELKKKISVISGNVVSEDGEIVKGIEIIERESIFEIDV